MLTHALALQRTVINVSPKFGKHAPCHWLMNALCSTSSDAAWPQPLSKRNISWHWNESRNLCRSLSLPSSLGIPSISPSVFRNHHLSIVININHLFYDYYDDDDDSWVVTLWMMIIVQNKWCDYFILSFLTSIAIPNPFSSMNCERISFRHGWGQRCHNYKMKLRACERIKWIRINQHTRARVTRNFSVVCALLWYAHQT